MSAVTIDMKERSISLWLTGLVMAFFVAAVQADNSCNVRLATTTSTVNSGLMDILIPAFEAKKIVTSSCLSLALAEPCAMLESGWPM